MATKAKELFIQKATEYLLSCGYQLDPSIKDDNQPRFFKKDQEIDFYNYISFELNKYGSEYSVELFTSPFIIYKSFELAGESASLFSYFEDTYPKHQRRFGKYNLINVEEDTEETFEEFKKVFESSADHFYNDQSKKLIDKTNILDIYRMVKSFAEEFKSKYKNLNSPVDQLYEKYVAYITPLIEEHKNDLTLIVPANKGTLYRVEYRKSYRLDNIPVVSFHQFVTSISKE